MDPMARSIPLASSPTRDCWTAVAERIRPANAVTAATAATRTTAIVRSRIGSITSIATRAPAKIRRLPTESARPCVRTA
jgi:hypothetical protein